MSLEQRDMNDEWSWTEDIDPRHSKHSISQSSTSISMSLSKRTLPSLSANGLQPLPFDSYNAPNSGYSNQSLHIIHNNNNKNNSNDTDDIKQNEQHKHKNNNKLNIIYDNKNFTKFNKTYKFNLKCDANGSHSKSIHIQSMASSTSSSFTSTSRPSHVKIIRISAVSASASASNLCCKETVVSCPKSLKRCIDEYKALHKFHSIFDPQNASKCTALYVNKKKSSRKYPKTVRLVMRYYPGDDLDDFLVDEEDGEVGFLYEDDFRTIMKKILRQLDICRQQNILHCDIKPNNIRINEQSEKYQEEHAEYYAVNLIDFGFAHLLSDKKKKEVKLPYIKGTPGFIAPETMRFKKYSHKSDMFSVGCVAFFLLTNHYAVVQAPDMDVDDMMPDRKRLRHLLKRENDRNRDDSSRIHAKTIEFVLSCLWRNPAKRPTAKQALKLQIFE